MEINNSLYKGRIPKSFFLCGLVVLFLGALLFKQLSHTHPKPFSYGPTLRPVSRINTDVSGLQSITCETFRKGRTAILMTLGQSNAQNAGEIPYRSTHTYTLNVLDGKCYAAQDPLPGIFGQWGSLWSRLGDLLIKDGLYDQVLIVPTSIGMEEIKAWGNNKWQEQLKKAYSQVKSHGLEITHLFWNHGENDARVGTSYESYLHGLESMVDIIRGVGIASPIIISESSICYNHGSEEVRRAQRDAPKLGDYVYAGVNTDQLSRFEHRFDMCHYSAQGLEQNAKLHLQFFRNFTQ
jgi:hypothetical protein